LQNKGSGKLTLVKGEMTKKENEQMELLTYQHHKPIQLKCSIDLNVLFTTENERNEFHHKWDAFIASDQNNSDIYDLTDNQLAYISEQIVPTKKDDRPPVLLVLGNPASHSVKSGMFFSFEGNGKEHRFWKSILKPSGILDLSFDSDQSVEKLNEQRRDALINLDYNSPFRIGLCVFISMPSAPAGKWGGIAGVQKLIGVRALRRLEQAETERVLECAKKFVTPDGAVIAFQKNAWDALRSDDDPSYSIDCAKTGKLKGRLKNNPDITLSCVPPTRLAGPCCKVLQQLKEKGGHP
jgi:hypothetical protein